jgi:hypothetical protein
MWCPLPYPGFFGHICKTPGDFVWRQNAKDGTLATFGAVNERQRALVWRTLVDQTSGCSADVQVRVHAHFIMPELVAEYHV